MQKLVSWSCSLPLERSVVFPVVAVALILPRSGTGCAILPWTRTWACLFSHVCVCVDQQLELLNRTGR